MGVSAFWGEMMQYLPGWTVQCINPHCGARGHWLRAGMDGQDCCNRCGEPLRTVPPPLAPNLRLRPRPLSTFRPFLRPR